MRNPGTIGYCADGVYKDRIPAASVEAFELYQEVTQDKAAGKDQVLASYIFMCGNAYTRRDYAKAAEVADLGLKICRSGEFRMDLLARKILALHALQMSKELQKTSRELLNLLIDEMPRQILSSETKYRCLCCFYDTNQKQDLKSYLRALLLPEMKFQRTDFPSAKISNELSKGRIPYEADLDLKKMLVELVSATNSSTPN